MRQNLYIGEVLSRIARLEQKTAELYAHYASLFRTDIDARNMFLQMKREEDGHVAMVRLQERVVNGSESSIVPMAVDMSGVDAIVQAIDAQLEKRDTGLLNALDFAIMLETNGMEFSYRRLMTKQNADLARLSSALTAGDEQHVNNLVQAKEAISRRGGTTVYR